jgi:hypothetical protein
MNKYLEKIAARKKGGQLQVRAGQKPLKAPKSKPFMSLKTKIDMTKGTKKGRKG